MIPDIVVLGQRNHIISNDCLVHNMFDGDCIFVVLQGLDGSNRPLLQFGFRVKFYVDSHLLLR